MCYYWLVISYRVVFFFIKKMEKKLELYDVIFLVGFVDFYWEIFSTFYKNLGRIGEFKVRGRGYYINGGY